MNFQNPLALWSLIPLSAFIIALYMLRMKRKELQVPASFLWPKVVEEVRANALFQRLKFSWLLILQLIIAALVCLTLARPQQRQVGLAGSQTVFVLDGSASMGATDGKPNRFEDAKTIIADAIRSSKFGDRIALIEAGPSPRVVFPLQNDAPRQLLALKDLGVSDAAVDLDEGLRLASALIGTEASGRIILLSDGGAELIKDFSPGKAQLIYQKMGSQSQNLGISAIGTASTQSGQQAFVEVSNFGDASTSTVLRIEVDGKLISSQQMTIKANSSSGKTLMIPAKAKVVKASIDSRDLLLADNVAYSVSNSGGNLRVLLISEGNLFLERALALDPRVTLDRSTTLPVTEKSGTEGESSYDLVIFDDVVEVPVKAAKVLNFGGRGSSIASITGSARGARAGLIEPVPLMRDVNLFGVYFGRTAKLTPKGQARSVADGSEGPMILEAPGKIVTSFVPLESDFPLNPSFPIFISNILDVLGGSDSNDALSIRPGQTFSLASRTDITLKSPDGKTQVLKSRDGTVVVREIRKVGEYEIIQSGKKKQVFASLNGPAESKIFPNATMDIASGKVESVRAPERFADFYKPLILLCLCVLAAEWWMFVRKS